MRSHFLHRDVPITNGHSSCLQSRSKNAMRHSKRSRNNERLLPLPLLLFLARVPQCLIATALPLPTQRLQLLLRPWPRKGHLSDLSLRTNGILITRNKASRCQILPPPGHPGCLHRALEQWTLLLSTMPNLHQRGLPRSRIVRMSQVASCLPISTKLVAPWIIHLHVHRGPLPRIRRIQPPSLI